MKAQFTIALVLMSFSILFADTWVFSKVKNEVKSSFGDITIINVIDATKNQSFPYFEIKIMNKDKIINTIKDESFGNLYSSKDNAFFIGISNSGIPKTAYIIFDSKGTVLKKVSHDQKALKYTERSVTISRVWYDEKNVNIEFEIKDEKLIDIKATNSSNERISLFKKVD